MTVQGDLESVPRVFIALIMACCVALALADRLGAQTSPAIFTVSGALCQVTRSIALGVRAYARMLAGQLHEGAAP